MRINLMHPFAAYRQGRRFVFRYTCPVGHVVNVFANSYRGGVPEPGVGAIMCPQCANSQKPDKPPEVKQC